jgi:hypothetical protein
VTWSGALAITAMITALAGLITAIAALIRAAHHNGRNHDD